MGPLSSEINVSVVIVNYNGLNLLDDCLKSFFTFHNELNAEVIIVDNGSTDGPVETVTSKYPSVKLIKNTRNLGFAKANNLGINIAKGKYTLILNNDVLFLDNVVERVFEFAEQSGDRLMLGIQLLNPDGSRQESVVCFPGLWNGITENFFLYKLFPSSKLFNKYYQNHLQLDKPAEVDVIKGAFMFLRTDELKKLNGFDERFFFYSEETDLCFRFKKSGGKILFLPTLKVVHLGGATTNNDLWFKFKNQTTGKIQYYQKHLKSFRFAVAILIHWIGLLLRGFLFSLAGIILINKKLVSKGYYFFRQLFVYPKNLFS